MPKKNLILPLLTALFIGFYFITLTKDAVLCYFSPDDLMNLHRSWAPPAGALVKANLLFFLNSPFYRPVGSDFYRVMFELAGLNPVPFHIVNLFILAANMWLTYCVARRLTGSKTAAALAALLISYHGRFINLYFDTGYIYDVLCCFFYFATLAFYLRVRSRPRPPRAWELVVMSAFFICALNAKEMAVTLPVSLLLYEWFYRRDAMRDATRSVRGFWKWLTADGRGVVVSGLLTLMFVIGRTRGGGLMENSAYQPVFSWRRFMETSVNFVSPLFFRDDRFPFPFGVVTLIWLVLLAVAWATRSRALKFAWFFLMLSVLPVAFIPPRGPEQYYITFFGWVLYAATLLNEITKQLFSRMPQFARFEEVRPAALLLCAAAAMYGINSAYTWSLVKSVAEEGEELRIIANQIHQLRPALRQGSRILFLHDPIEDPWRIQALISLSYGDDSLEIDRGRNVEKPLGPSDIASYDYVFDYRHGHLYSSPQPPIIRPQPEIVYEYGYPVVYHGDWTRITPRTPAKHGEGIICMMQDLGNTNPPVGHDKPFPENPFAEVLSAVEVRVDGHPVEVLRKFGWPGRVNRYRVDFQIPESVQSGEPEIVVKSGDNVGLPTPILVR